MHEVSVKKKKKKKLSTKIETIKRIEQILELEIEIFEKYIPWIYLVKWT